MVSAFDWCIDCCGRASVGGDIVVDVGHCYDDYFDVIGSYWIISWTPNYEKDLLYVGTFVRT